MANPQTSSTGLTLSHRNVGSFRANFNYQNVGSGNLDMAARTFEAGEDVLILRASRPANVTKFLHTALVECNTAEGAPQQSAYYLSVLIAVFPGMYDLAVAMFRDTGYNVQVVNEDNLHVFGITLKDWIDTPTALTAFGQLALIIYKHIDSRSYERFFSSRTNAIKAEAGFAGSLVPETSDILLNMEVAKTIRIMVGGSTIIRAGLLRMILFNKDGELRRNRVCNYLSDIISWTEMSTVVFIFEGLCMTKSPILRDPRIRHEMHNLALAFDKITYISQPQYYRILHPTEAGVMIVKSRFPTLAEVARKYCMQRSDSVGQFAQNQQSANTLVTSLYNKHIAYMARTAESRDLSAFRYLTEIEFQREEANNEANPAMEETPTGT